ncbi:MAG: hypothetical protein QM301_00340 [Bacteroidota bacterium]|jgi:hypothetical protein|nr:hypothetical protein [Bacteroidota bacterium]NLT00246.1 hypothetical protein [Bacteroidales bacterium]HOC87878.1 hypothetical protein [Prolixibacteraceae bacterium]HOF55264.1 hypothetical protein [Prolixibacteraceae bacterium]HOG97225.1 hypothetical protein [Prolixibacteraceae bacterium]
MPVNKGFGHMDLGNDKTFLSLKMIKAIMFPTEKSFHYSCALTPNVNDYKGFSGFIQGIVE